MKKVKERKLNLFVIKFYLFFVACFVITYPEMPKSHQQNHLEVILFSEIEKLFEIVDVKYVLLVKKKKKLINLITD